MSDFKRLPLVEVQWEDAYRHPDGWMSSEEYVKELEVPPSTMLTAGFLVAENDRYVAVALSMGENGQLSDVMQIPRGMVREIIPLVVMTNLPGEECLDDRIGPRLLELQH